MASLFFTQNQLNNIMEQGMIRQCACPTLLTRLLSDARFLNEYQRSCLESAPTDRRVHRAIERVTETVAGILESALVEVMALEGWEADDAGEFKMPESLVELQLQAINCMAQPRV